MLYYCVMHLGKAILKKNRKARRKKKKRGDGVQGMGVQLKVAALFL